MHAPTREDECVWAQLPKHVSGRVGSVAKKTNKNKLKSSYKSAPEPSALGGNILGQTNVSVGVDNGIASKIEPTVLKIIVYQLESREKQIGISVSVSVSLVAARKE